MWQNRPYKSLMRTLAVEASKAAQVYFTLPSDELRDIHQALEMGSINRNTFIIAVEQDKAKARKIEQQLAKLFRSYHVHSGPLHTFNVIEVLNGRKIDFAFFDLCGCLTAAVAVWFMWQRVRYGQTIFANGAQVSFTLCQQYRKNRLIDKLANHGDDLPRLSMMSRLLQRCPFATGKPALDGGWSSSTLLTMYALYGVLAYSYRLTLQAVHEYHDTVSPMLFVKLTIDGETKTSGNAVSSTVLRSLMELAEIAEPKQPKTQQIPDWQLLGCHPNMGAGKKAAAVRKAKSGVCPPWLSGAKWSWHSLNPNGRKVA